MTNVTEMRVSKTDGQVTGIRRIEVVQRALENARRVASVCDEYRGLDVVVLDLTQITPLFDYFVIATGKSRRQLHAISDHADDVMADESGSNRRSTAGYDSEWICQDYGDVVLHVFSPDARQLYDLENLWADAPRVDWQAVVESEA